LTEYCADISSHLSGYRNSAPVRIGNGAATHQQFDIYGELLDGIYLYNKYGKPVTWDQWVAVREILDYVITIYKGTSKGLVI
jgi:GH15 family glucan-1,4-alpha-glucosidase